MIIFIILILGLDQLTKSIAASNLHLNQSLPVIKNIFHLTLVHNRGAAFGILQDQAFLFILTACLAIAVILMNFKKIRTEKRISLRKIALGLIMAGAAGNLIDRLRSGYVIDFLDFRVWPVFNIADSSITVGAVLLCWVFLREPKTRGMRENPKA
jgi:signal peptidase II